MGSDQRAHQGRARSRQRREALSSMARCESKPAARRCLQRPHANMCILQVLLEESKNEEAVLRDYVMGIGY